MYLSTKYGEFCPSIEKVNFDAVVGYLALTHIIQSKAEPTTNRVPCTLYVIALG